MRTDSLSERITRGKSLSEDDQDRLLEILGKGCHAKTKRQLARALSYVPDIPNYPGFERLTRENGEWGYCAGQSYPDEIRRLRERLRKHG